MSHMNALHLHEEVAEAPRGFRGWWEEHSTSFFTVVIIAAVGATSWAVWSHWEIVKDTVLSTMR
jgi:predicted negative regulator of RcsB-dependent stress response